MNTYIQQILVEDHLRTLHAEAATARLAHEARQTPNARPNGLIRRTGWRPEFVARLVARLAGS
jgi:hypothetical protein